jgi:uncharacterized 2Fe-2S/4Fe-4S cluster protein (DUF4445 family)
VAAPRFTVRLLPDGGRLEADAPVDLYLAAAAAGVLLDQPCGGQGACGRCRVRVVAGAPPASDADRAVFTLAEIAAGWRLGCRLFLASDAVVEIPVVARSVSGKSFGGDLPAGALGRPVVAPRPSGSGPGFGLAVDIGTTSLAAALVSLADGAIAASAAALNPQAAFGADVISRIRHTLETPDGLAHLRDAVRSGLAGLVGEMAASVGCGPGDIVLAAVAGNPTMTQAWRGVPVAGLGRAPFEAAWSGAVTLEAAEVGLPIAPAARVLVFPLVRSHVGGDLVSAAVACGLDEDRRLAAPRLLIDLGTNTELLLAHEGRLLTTSAAAGPAFEGVSISQGMRSGPGAIDVVSIAPDGRVSTHVAGGLPPRGICGSGLIDAVAELLRAGVVTSSGRMKPPADVGAPALAARLAMVDGQQAFTLCDGGGPTSAGPVRVTARDVREVQLAKGSILAAAALLCRRAGLPPDALAEVLVAGAFGSSLRKASALGIGLLPPIDPERVRLVGNAAGAGARLALLDARVFDRAIALARRAEYVDLAGEEGYEDAFMAALAFPGR